MGTKNTTSTTNQYNPAALNTYNQLQGPATGLLSNNINNPNSSPFFSMGSNAATARTGANNAAFTQAGSALGTNMTPGFGASSTAFNMRGGMARGAQMNNNLLIGAAQNREQSLQSGLNYRPLQTGGTSTQQTSGLGTWLPQVIGAGIGAATSFFGIPDPLKFGGAQSAQQMSQWAGSNYGGAPTSPTFTPQDMSGSPTAF